MKIIIRGIAESLKCLHENFIVHGDLKLENIIYNKRTKIVKIIDFDLCVPINEETLEYISDTLFGTNGYVAPESKLMFIYSPKTDVWQLGIILYMLLTHDFPCENKCDVYCTYECLQNMKDTMNTYINDRKIHNSISALIYPMLSYDEYRYSIDQILNSFWLNL